MRILKFTMFETNGAIDQPARPYELDMREGAGAVIDDLDRLTNGGTHISSVSLSRLSSGILVPSTNVHSTNIVGGWGGKRIIFAMVVGVEEHGNYRDVRYISGYTDHCDIAVDSRGRVLFPDDMRLYFNSVTKITLNEVSVRDSGRKIRPTIRDNNLLLRRDSLLKDDGTPRSKHSHRENTVLLRPVDVLRRSGSQANLSTMFSTIPDTTVRNTVGHFNLSTQLSRRKNNNSAEYMAYTLGKYIGARSMGEDDSTRSGFDPTDGSHSDPDYMTAASVQSGEDVMNHDPFFEEMIRLSNIIQTGFVEWGDLKAMDPDFDESRDLPFVTWKAQLRRAKINREATGGNYTGGIADYEGSSSFYEVTPESTAALMIAQAIPEIMINAMYAGVQNLTLNTHPQHGEPSVHLGMAFPFMDGIPLEYGFNYLRTQFEQVILPNVSKNGLMHIEAMVNVDIDRDIEVWITMDGGPEEYFCYPVWAEALVTPTVTDNEEDLDVISKGVGHLLEDFAIHTESRSSRNLDIRPTKDLFRRGDQPVELTATPRSDRGKRVYSDSPAPRRGSHKPLVLDLPPSRTYNR